MNSASTTRRHRSTAADVHMRTERLMRFAVGWLDGVDSNIRHKRQAAARAQVDVVRAALNDLPGLVAEALSVHAEKIKDATPYSDAPLPWNHRAEKEIQRLRAAMVHAMDDCEALLQWPGVGARERAAIRTIASTLKAALEKK